MRGRDGLSGYQRGERKGAPMKCSVCRKTIPTARRKLQPNVKTCSGTCSGIRQGGEGRQALEVLPRSRPEEPRGDPARSPGARHRTTESPQRPRRRPAATGRGVGAGRGGARNAWSQGNSCLPRQRVGARAESDVGQPVVRRDDSRPASRMGRGPGAGAGRRARGDAILFRLGGTGADVDQVKSAAFRNEIVVIVPTRCFF